MGDKGSVKSKSSIVKKENILPTVLLILGGVTAILVATAIHMSETHGVITWHAVKTFTVHVLLHFGIALFVIGFVTFWVEMDHWIAYFKKQLSNIIQEKEYLSSLNDEELKGLQKNLLQAMFKNSEIGHTGGFYEYYENNIQTLMGTPFREDIKILFRIDHNITKTSFFKVEETLEWVCRSNNEKIQNSITYKPDKDELYDLVVKSVCINHEQTGMQEFDEEKLKQGNYFTDESGLNFPIPKQMQLDKLQVLLTVSYNIPKDYFFAWRMVYPSKGVELNIRYPKELQIRKEFYIADGHAKKSQGLVERYKYPGDVTFETYDWLLPNEGITFQVVPEVASQNNVVATAEPGKA